MFETEGEKEAELQRQIRKKELSEEANSKESKPLSQETIGNAPVTRKSLKKPTKPASKRMRKEVPDDQTVSE